MIGRLLATASMLALALGAVCGDVLGIGYPTGLLFVLLAALAWFQWDAVREGFGAAKDESNIPIVRLGAKIIGGMEFLRRGSPRRRSTSSPSG